MNKLRIYLDTSVISFLFAEDSPDFTAITREFFNIYSIEYDLFISDIVFLEISKNTNQTLKERMIEIVQKYPISKLENNTEIQSIAKIYIESKVIPTKKVEDALHVAFSTYHQMDILLSWNFRHLSNIYKERKILIENLKLGYNHPLRLLSPLEVLNEIND